jgi:hypothetical protein
LKLRAELRKNRAEDGIAHVDNLDDAGLREEVEELVNWQRLLELASEEVAEK